MIILRLIKKSMKWFSVFGKKNAVFTLILDTMGLDIRPFPPFLASASSRASIASTSMGWCCKKLMTSYNVFPSLGGYHYLRHGGVSEISSRGFSRPPYRKPNFFATPPIRGTIFWATPPLFKQIFSDIFHRINLLVTDI